MPKDYNAGNGKCELMHCLTSDSQQREGGHKFYDMQKKEQEERERERKKEVSECVLHTGVNLWSQYKKVQ